MNISDKKPLLALAALTVAAAGFALGQSKLVRYEDSPAGQERLAIEALQRDHLTTAFAMFQKLARDGDKSAAFYLGQMYQDGDGAPRDGAEAVKWLTVAARADNAAAARQLGLLYLDGADEVQNLAKARQWFGVAAKDGDRLALRSLGEMNASGLGGPADLVKAYAYYSVAAARGSGYSAVLRDRIAKRLDPQQQREGEKDAARIVAEIKPTKSASHASTPAASAATPAAQKPHEAKPTIIAPQDAPSGANTK